jgi:polyphosphate kinase
MCSLRPGLKGVSDTIKVISVIGRFLEHSRLFWFANHGHAELYLGSADWMERNLDRRVEAVVPVHDPELCISLEWLLQLYLSDPSAWVMQSDGRYRKAGDQGKPVEQEAQATLMELWGSTQLKRDAL